MSSGRDTPNGIARRDLMFAGAGIAALSALPAQQPASAQTTPAPSAPAGGAVPGRVVVEQRGAVLLVGLDLAEAQGRLTPQAIIGLGKAIHQLEQDDGLRVAVLHSVGRDFCVGLDVPAFAAAQATGVLPPKGPDFIN